MPDVQQLQLQHRHKEQTRRHTFMAMRKQPACFSATASAAIRWLWGPPCNGEQRCQMCSSSGSTLHRASNRASGGVCHPAGRG
jgi:hypothetical protein